MADEMAADWALSIWLMRGCGLRIGEALAGAESSVRGSLLRVSAQMYDRPPRIGPMKHRKPGEYRDVPLPDYVAKRIAAHIEAHGTGRDGLLFQGRVQELPSQHTVRTSFMAATREAGLPLEFTPHSLRHCFASVALSRGVPITDVSRWLGHRSVDLTYRTYSHFLPDARSIAPESCWTPSSASCGNLTPPPRLPEARPAPNRLRGLPCPVSR